jgi:hypothetical protein
VSPRPLTDTEGLGAAAASPGGPVVLAATVAAAAGALTLADIGWAVLVALIGIPFAMYAASLQNRRVTLVAPLVALTVNGIVIAYWIYYVAEALQGAR